MEMNKQDWLFKLRRCTLKATLEKVIEANHYKLPDKELMVFQSAADHRLAELAMGRLFDKVPASVWRHVH